MSANGITEGSTAEIDVELPPRVVDVILVALKPESMTPSSERSTTSISKNPSGVNITTKASDTTALRAAVNSYLRWIQGILNMIEKIE